MEIAVLVSAGILLALLGGLVGVALGRYVWPAIRGVDTAALLAAQNEGARLRKNAAPFARRQSSSKRSGLSGSRSCAGRGKKRPG